MAEFKPAFDKMIILEGGFVLHTVKGDRGGQTYAGIARNIHPKWEGWGKIDSDEYDSELTELVRRFYKKSFWDRIKGDDITSQIVADTIFSFAVNAGIKTSVKIMQRVIGATCDGVFGPKSLQFLNEMIEDDKDERIFILTFNLLKVFRYKNICMNDSRRKNDHVESNLKFLCGWINRVERGL